jgi:hypothetical protein
MELKLDDTRGLEEEVAVIPAPLLHYSQGRMVMTMAMEEVKAAAAYPLVNYSLMMKTMEEVEAGAAYHLLLKSEQPHLNEGEAQMKRAAALDWAELAEVSSSWSIPSARPHRWAPSRLRAFDWEEAVAEAPHHPPPARVASFGWAEEEGAVLASTLLRLGQRRCLLWRTKRVPGGSDGEAEAADHQRRRRGWCQHATGLEEAVRH